MNESQLFSAYMGELKTLNALVDAGVHLSDNATYLAQIARVKAASDAWEAAKGWNIPPAPCPLPEPPVDPDDTKPVIIPPKPSRARRMFLLQAAMKCALAELRSNLQAVLDEGVQRGHFTAVVRPDGQIGYALTDAAYQWMEEEGL